MQKLIFFLAVLTACIFNASGQTVCHTELIAYPLEKAVVGDAKIINTGQSISGLVKDHARNVKGYTSKMFEVDNPHIAGRNTVTKFDPCDSTKVKYITTPLYAGDTVYLRLPYKVDTLAEKSESVVWKPAKKDSHLCQIIHMDDEGRWEIEFQDITCSTTGLPPTTTPGPGIDKPKTSPVSPPVGPSPPFDPKKPIDGGDKATPTKPDDQVNSPGNEKSSPTSPGSPINPNYGVIIIILMLLLFLAGWVVSHFQHRKTREAISQQPERDSTAIISAVTKEGEKTRDHVKSQHSQTKEVIAGRMSEMITKQGETNETLGKTNELLQAFLERNAPAGKDEEKK